jgi:hypothetical protein
MAVAAEAIRLLIAAGAHDQALAAADENLREPGGHGLALHMLALRAATSAGRHLEAYEHIRAVLDDGPGAGPSHREFSIPAGELQQLASDLFQSGALAETSDLARSMLLSGVVFPETYLLLANAEAELGGDALPTWRWACCATQTILFC